MKAVSITFSLVLLLGVVSCSSTSDEVPVRVEYYKSAYRQFPPDPVYSRLMWSQLPKPIMPKSTDNAPYLLPTIAFELPDSTLGEAIEALAQTMGYRWDYPSGLAKRAIHIRMDGTVEEVLKEIGRQGGVQTMLDHEQRLVRVMGEGVLPSLPESK
jgi:hypothetical protein